MSKTYKCIVPGCDRDDFETPWGVRVHCTRSHKELGKWREEWDELMKARKQLSIMPKVKKPARGKSIRTDTYAEGIIAALRSAQAALATDQPMEPLVDADSLTVENHMLRRMNQKKADAILGLTRIIVTLVADD